MSDEIRISVSGFSECALAYPNIRPSKLRPFKFKNKGEGAGRSAYYKKAIDTIREYHASGNDPAVFKRVKRELSTLLNAASRSQERTKLLKNIDALSAYERVYGDRRFVLHTRSRLTLLIGHVTITAQPDLWVSENGVEVLIKIGAAKKNPQQIDMMIYLLRKAAVSSGHPVRARNVVYLDITNGRERCCNTHLIRFNRMFRNVANSIEQNWTDITPASR